MVIVTRYTIGREADTETYYIRSREAPLLPPVKRPGRRKYR